MRIENDVILLKALKIQWAMQLWKKLTPSFMEF